MMFHFAGPMADYANQWAIVKVLIGSSMLAKPDREGQNYCNGAEALSKPYKVKMLLLLIQVRKIHKFYPAKIYRLAFAL